MIGAIRLWLRIVFWPWLVYRHLGAPERGMTDHVPHSQGAK